ncbi:MAG TPA: bacteriophage abortive infection AbiH family protein [Clostridia bacterium]|nr:bacteriophage abortive infection AbiH family protein [Clostridia bacterium]
MPNLYIIGNGFDLAHRLPTAYSHFRKFLIDNYDADEEIILNVPSITTGNHGEDIFDDSEIASLSAHMLVEANAGENWSDFENALGRFDYGEFFEYAADYDKDGEENLFHTYNNMEDISSGLLQTIPRIKDLFCEWIKTVKISRIKAPKKIFANKINPDEDMFLSFNYTHTLEIIYGCQNVCHIHGDVNSDILVGHGYEYDETEYQYNEGHYFGAQDNIQKLKRALRKNTDLALRSNKAFFKKLSDISNVYSVGFSYNDIDLIYICEICNAINDSISNWIINNYNITDEKEISAKLRNCGYNGSIEFEKII